MGTIHCVALLRGTLEGTVGFAAFCAVAGALLERTGIAAAFAVALTAALIAQVASVRARMWEPSLGRLGTDLAAVRD
jgi:hypothetical protein